MEERIKIWEIELKTLTVGNRLYETQCIPNEENTIVLVFNLYILWTLISFSQCNIMIPFRFETVQSFV